MKKILILLGLSLSLFSAKGIDTSLLVTNSETLAIPAYSNVISGPCRVQLLSLVNPNNASFGTFYILDAPVGVTNVNGAQTQIYRYTNFVTNAFGQIGYSNGAYNSTFQYTTNVKVFYTNAMGLTNFQVFTNVSGSIMYTNNPVYQSNVLWTGTNTAVASTNAYRVLFSGTLGALATLTITNQFNCIYGLGIQIPNLSSNTVNVTWSSSL